MPIQIHNKTYVTVAERVQEAGKDFVALNTEVLFQDPVVVKATVITNKGTFTGISAANPDKTIEKQSPYEVAETSAVGRALGFAGYGVVEGIATADEIVKAETPRYDNRQDTAPTSKGDEYEAQRTHFCKVHQRELKRRETNDGIIWDHRLQIDGVWNICRGAKWIPQTPYVKIPERDINDDLPGDTSIPVED